MGDPMFKGLCFILEQFVMCVTRLSAVERLKELASLRQWSSQGSELNKNKSSFLSKYSSLSFILATANEIV